jgi:hypothetical protein
MKKIFTLIASVLIGSFGFSQSIGIVGAFNGWGNDVVMNSQGGDTFLANAVVIGADGGLKFRQDGAWTRNWGGDAFPSGTASVNGSDIMAVAGTYDVMFDTLTLEYSFTPAQTSFDVVAVGGVFSTGMTADLLTTDGDVYTKKNLGFLANGAVFVVNGTSVMGGTGELSGNATVGGAQIPLTKGYYNITFTKSTGAYVFEEVNVGIIGSAVLPGPDEWNVDVNMVSTDRGITFKLSQFVASDGAFKFRVNDDWGYNWGEIVDDGTDIDTATVGASDIAIVAGTYDISFNRYTGIFCVSSTACTIEEGFPSGVGVNELESTFIVLANPNPTESVITFDVKSLDFEITIADLTGKVVKTSKNADVNVSDLNSGTYIYSISSEGKIATGKIIKK